MQKMIYMIDFLIKVCPYCGTGLKVEKGIKDDTLKLICPNRDCDGSNLKRIQKGIEQLKIKSIGPAIIEKLVKCGVNSSLDLFNPNIINRENLINSGYFSDGKTLENIIENISKIKSLNIDDAILSLQIMIPKDDDSGYISIGQSLSIEIGKYISEVPYNFEGLSIQIREEIQNSESELYKSILNYLNEFENLGIKIVYFEKNIKPIEIKKLDKKVAFQDEPTVLNLSKDDILSKLNWTEVELNDGCDLLLIENECGDLYEKAKSLNIKTITFKKLKLLYL